MIKRLIAGVLFSALAAIHAAAQAQPNRFPPINLVAGDPTGTACPANSIVQSSTSGILYSCQGGAYRMPGGTSIPPTMVTWPPACTGGTYVPASNTCVPTGTAANPGGSIGQTQINVGGTFSGIPGSLTDATYGWKTQGGIQYAKGWQTGAGNNGIFNAQANNALVVADPSYAFTELPGPYSFTGSPVYYHDLRNAQQTNVYRNPQVAAGKNFDFNVYPLNGAAGTPGIGAPMSGISNYCMYDAPAASKPYCQTLGVQANMPGFSLGLPSGFTAGIGGWYNNQSLEIVTQSRNAGISASIGIFGSKFGIGDNDALYIYHHSRGGRVALADESSIPVGINSFEDADYVSTCVAGSGCTPGSVSIKGALGNAGNQGVGQYLIDTTQTPISGNITAIAAGLSGGQAFTIDATVTQSNAWGTFTVVNTPNNGVPPFTTTEAVTVTVTAGTFVAGTLVCFGGAVGTSGNYHEQAIPSSVSGSPPAQTLTFSTTSGSGLRRPHSGGGLIMQGGACGTGLESTYYTTQGGTRYVFDVIGSTDTHTLQVGQFLIGSYGATPIPATIYQIINLTNATTSAGTTVSAVYTATGSQINHPWNFVGNSWVLSGSSDSALNATCTNSQWQDLTHFTCTIAALVPGSTHTTTTPIVATLGINGFKLWPIAETLDVQNYNEALCDPTSAPAGPHAPCVDGTFALEPNVIQFADNNGIEQLNHVSMNFKAYSAGMTTRNPFQSMTGLGILISGYGNQGGALTTGSNAFLNLTSQALANQWINGGGILNPPNLINAQGQYFYGLNTSTGPASDQAVINIQTTTAQQNNSNYNFDMFAAINKSPAVATHLNLVPNTGDSTLTSGRILTLTGSPVTVTGDLGAEIFHPLLTISPLVAPTLTATPSSTGGTLATGTYYYQVQARGAAAPGSGNYYSVRSNEVTCIIPGSVTTGSCTLTWNPVAGAGSYYPSRGATTGTELNASNPVAGLSNTRYVDDNSATFSGGANASAAPAIAINSAGTAFTTTIQAPANQTANITVTVTKITTVSITPAAVTASTCAEQTFNTYTGLATGQVVTVSPPAFLGAHVWIASTRVSAANTLAIAFCADATGGTPAAGIYSAMAF